MKEIDIKLGEKFACIALLDLDAEVESRFDSLRLGLELYVSKAPPISISNFWRETLGSVESEELEKASLWVLTKKISGTPELVDRENSELANRIGEFFYAILISDFTHTAVSPYLLTGANANGKPDVRQVSRLPRPKSTMGTIVGEYTVERFKIAAAIYEALRNLHRKQTHKRIYRAVNSFLDGVFSSNADDKLHRFVRAIEGFIKPETGNTKKQFASRTELFIGPSYHTLIHNIFDLRSNVEHLHSPLTAICANTKKEKIETLLRSAILSEAMARYCLIRLLTTNKLFPYFAEDNAIDKFWNLDKDEKRNIWGDVLDLKVVDKSQINFPMDIKLEWFA